MRVLRRAAAPLASLVILAVGSASYGASGGPSKELLKAARQGKAEKAASLVSRVSPDDAAEALIVAASWGHLNVVQVLVAKGVGVNGGVGQGGGSSKRSGLEVTMSCPLGGPPDPTIPLIAAVRAGNLDVVSWLAEHKADLDLQEAVCVFEDVKQTGSVSEFRVVREAGAGNNALSEAVLGGQISIFKYLVEHGANLSRRVVYRPAAVPGFVGFRYGLGLPGVLIRGAGGVVYEVSYTHFSIGSDGEITTDLKVELQQLATIRELALQSAHPEIKEFAKAHGAGGGHE